jgi:hypothetical protein
MFDNQKFQKLVEAGNLTGEVIATNSFIIDVKGLEGVTLGAQVLFEDGQRAIVRSVLRFWAIANPVKVHS